MMVFSIRLYGSYQIYFGVFYTSGIPIGTLLYNGMVSFTIYLLNLVEVPDRGAFYLLLYSMFLYLILYISLMSSLMEYELVIGCTTVLPLLMIYLCLAARYQVYNVLLICVVNMHTSDVLILVSLKVNV
jgi:hypothetical protein